MIEYNYNFLREWIVQTKTTYREVMRAVGNSNSSNLHNWLGDGPAQKRQAEKGERVHPVAMNVESMVRFCNHFHLSSGVFFLQDGKPMSETADKTLQQMDTRLYLVERLLGIVK